MTIQIIIFSYNRAMQLDALLTSIASFWKYPDIKIHVLYNASDNTFSRGYERLKELYSEVTFTQENTLSYSSYSLAEMTNYFNLKLLYLCSHLRGRKSDFRKKLLRILKDSDGRLTMFLTDDSVFIRPTELSQEDMDWLTEHPYLRQLSFRHGAELIGERRIRQTNTGYEWLFSEFSSNDHWGYRFSLDAHVYCREAILSLLQKASFSNPNTLESSGLLHSQHRSMFIQGRCLPHIMVLSFPINIVQKTFQNESLCVNPSLLNDLFLEEYKLEYPKIDSVSTFQVYPQCVYVCKEGRRKEIRTKYRASGK